LNRFEGTMSDEKTGTRREGGVATKEKPKTERPKRYKVLLHNDDYTPMEFVVAILQQLFRLGEVDATRVMLHIHHQGVGIAGVFTYEIAETKVQQVLAAAKRHEFPLQCSTEIE
jgi:ATP-dependent Clp protease adaptor protein ClpS